MADKPLDEVLAAVRGSSGPTQVTLEPAEPVFHFEILREHTSESFGLGLIEQMLAVRRAGGAGSAVVAEEPCVVVSHVAANSPSERAGIRPGVMLTSVDGQSVESNSLDEASPCAPPATQIALLRPFC